MKTSLIRTATLILLTQLLGLVSDLHAQGTAFTYQGRLESSGSPYTGDAEFQATLWSVPAGGTALATNAPASVIVGVTNGLLVLPLDFGANFAGADRWLQLDVRTTIGPFTTLSPRQKLSPTPYAITASNLTGTVSASQLTGAISSNNIGAGSITTVMLATGAVGSNQLAAGAVTTSALADGAVSSPKMSTTSNWFALTITKPSPAASDGFGNSVAAVGTDRVLIGAYGDDTGASGAGAAYLFAVESYSPGVIADGVRARSITTAELAEAAVTVAKLADGAVTAAKIGGMLLATQIPNLDASKITTGTMADARLSANVALLDTAQIFTADQSFGAGAQVLLDAGSVTSPGVTFVGDADTGIFHPAGNSVAVATGGTERLRVDSSGRVGIGTATPSRELEVQHPGDTELGIKSTDTGGHLWTLQSSAVSGIVNLDASFQIIDRTAGGARLLIGTNGNVGIGTSNPTNKLHVIGGATFTSRAGGANQTVAWAPGNASWSFTSDRNAKDRVEPVNPQSVLEKVSRLPINEWSYIGYDQRHIGPMAQDFHAAFPLNESDTTLNDCSMSPASWTGMVVGPGEEASRAPLVTPRARRTSLRSFAWPCSAMLVGSPSSASRQRTGSDLGSRFVISSDCTRSCSDGWPSSTT